MLHEHTEQKPLLPVEEWRTPGKEMKRKIGQRLRKARLVFPGQVLLAKVTIVRCQPIDGAEEVQPFNNG